MLFIKKILIGINELEILKWILVLNINIGDKMEVFIQINYSCDCVKGKLFFPY